MASLDFAKKVLQHVWAEFINHFDAAANVDLLFPMELIDFPTMDVISNAKSKKAANHAFLSHLMNNAIIESLWKLRELLRDTNQDHGPHARLAKLLKNELKQWKSGGRGGDGPSSSQATTSELSNKVFSEKDAASRLGIVAALDLSEVTSQQTYTDAWLAKDPPHLKIRAEFCRLQSRLAKIFNKHIDDLKPFLRICQRSRKWPFKELEVKDIDTANSIRNIFTKMCIEKCWLNTEIFIRLIDVLPDKKSHDKAKQHLEVYHKLLGVFSKCVLLSHIPKDDARLEYFCSCMFPKLRVTYDVNMKDFDVSQLLKQRKFLSKIFQIPKKAFHYLKAEPTNSTLVTWALDISIEKAFKLFRRVTHEFWSLKEHLIIKVEIESDGIFQLHMKGRNLPYQIKKALQGNQELLACTEHVSRQFLALVDYSHLKRTGTEPRLQPALKSVLQPSGPSNVAGSETQRQARTGDGDGTSSADVSQHVYYPVIGDLKISFSKLAGNVLSIIGSLSSKHLETFCYFLSNYLKPSLPPDAPLPVIPEVQDLKPFLIRRWDPLQIDLLKAVVQHLASRRIQAGNFKSNVQQVKAELNAYEDLLKSKLPEFLSKSTRESVSLQSYPGQSYVSVKIASNPAEISLSRIVKLQGFFIHNLGLPDTLFTGFSEGCIVLFSIPTECVWSLPSCLLPSNLSLLEEWKVLFFSVKGALTVDIKERRVVHSLDKHSLLSSLAEYKTLNDDLRTKVQQMKKDLYLKEEELRLVVEGELKVSRKGKGKAVTTDREVEEKVSFKEKSVVKTELSPYPDHSIKTESSPDVSPEPSSKRFKTGSDSLTYEPPLEKKSEEKGQDTLLQAKDTQIAKLLEEIQRLKQENNLLHQSSFTAEEPASSSSPAKPFKPEQNKVFRSDLVRPGQHHSVKMADLLIPTCHATPVTIGRDVYLAGGVTSVTEVETDKLVLVYNMDSGDCRTLPPSPQYKSEAVAIDGTLVLIGGRDSSTHKYTNMVSTWMAAEERWTQDLPAMKMKRFSPGVLLLNNHLFVFGGVGEDEKTRLDSFEVLDLNTKQWSEGRGSLPQPLSSPQLGVFGDYVMLYGGWTSAGHRVSRACYSVPVQALVDSATNPLSPPIHWTPVQDAPYSCSTLLTTSQDAMLIGGDSKYGQVTRAIHRFSSSGSWEVIGELSEPRARPTVVAVSDKSFLVLAGDSDPHSPSFSTLLKSVELISY